MQDWIAGSLAVLGTLMVLAGSTLIVLKTMGRMGALPDAATQPLGGALGSGQSSGHGSGQGEPATVPEGMTRSWFLRRLNPSTQLIAWGVLLLVLAAMTVDLIVFEFGVTTRE